MKNIKPVAIILLSITFAFSSCKKDGLLDPTAMVALNGRENPAASTAKSDMLSIGDIVRQADEIFFTDIDTAFSPNKPLTIHPRRVIYYAHRDTVNNRILMWATDIISAEGDLLDECGNFIRGRNTVLVKYIIKYPGHLWDDYDTIAYIPNAVMDAARKAIRAAYARGDYRQCYELFEEAYTFHPTTGEEYKRLMQKEEK